MFCLKCRLKTTQRRVSFQQLVEPVAAVPSFLMQMSANSLSSFVTLVLHRRYAALLWPFSPSPERCVPFQVLPLFSFRTSFFPFFDKQPGEKARAAH